MSRPNSPKTAELLPVTAPIHPTSADATVAGEHANVADSEFPYDPTTYQLTGYQAAQHVGQENAQPSRTKAGNVPVSPSNTSASGMQHFDNTGPHRPPRPVFVVAPYGMCTDCDVPMQAGGIPCWAICFCVLFFPIGLVCLCIRNPPSCPKCERVNG